MGKTAFFSAFAGTVERATGIIRGVSVITEGEAKGHPFKVDAETLATIKACAEQFKDGVRVKVNHGTGFDSIVGSLRAFRIEGNQLKADLHLLKTSEMRDQILEIAEEMPGSVGLSVSFSGDDQKIDGEKYARCLELYSVDFVDHPAANPSGLFSACIDSPQKGMAENLFANIKDFFTLSREVAAPVIELENKLKLKDTELAAALKTSTELSAKVTELEGKISGHAEELKKLEASVEDRAGKKALSITAGQGQPPIAQTPTATPAAAGDDERAKISKLSGLAKVIALEKFEAAQRKGK